MITSCIIIMLTERTKNKISSHFRLNNSNEKKKIQKYFITGIMLILFHFQLDASIKGKNPYLNVNKFIN